MKVAWIAAQTESFSLAERCAVLEVSVSGYRAWKRGGAPGNPMGQREPAAVIRILGRSGQRVEVGAVRLGAQKDRHASAVVCRLDEGARHGDCPASASPL